MNADPFTEETARAHALLDISHIQFREPVVKNGVDLKIPLVDTQWQLLVGMVMGEILKPEAEVVREVVKRIGAQAVSEALPGLLIDELSGVMPAIEERETPELDAIIEYDTVPPTLLLPDVRHAPKLVTAEWATDELASTLFTFGVSYQYTTRLHDIKYLVDTKPGVTREEKTKVIELNKLGRGVKILGLVAELIDNPAIEAVEGDDGEITFNLPSGAKIVFDESKLVEYKDLLDPNVWQSANANRDRVRKAWVGGKPFIIKEQKSPTHESVHFRDGYKKSRTSKQEFRIAKELSGLGPIDLGEIILEWEQPIGYAKLSGYQFTIFEYNTAIADNKHPREALAHNIMGSPDTYAEEFGKITNRYKEILEIPTGVKALFRSDDHRALSYEEFARIKADCMVFVAENLIISTTIEHGYENDDVYGVGFDLHNDEDGKCKLVAIGYDFEYFKKISKFDKQKVENNDKHRRDKAARNLRWINNPQMVDDVYRAACFAMLESMGYQVTPNANEAD